MDQKDPIEVAPNIYKVLFENDKVRLLEITMKPGDKSEMHHHPASLNYVIKGGKAKMTLPDGQSMDMEMKDGDHVWQEAISHSVENTGTEEVKVIAVELKQE